MNASRSIPRTLTFALCLASLAATSCISEVDEARSTFVDAEAGGYVYSANGALSLEIPAGALAQDTMITIREVPPEEWDEATLAAEPLGPVYQLEPAGLTFAAPVHVSLAFEHDLERDGATLFDVGTASVYDILGDSQTTYFLGDELGYLEIDLDHFTNGFFRTIAAPAGSKDGFLQPEDLDAGFIYAQAHEDIRTKQVHDVFHTTVGLTNTRKSTYSIKASNWGYGAVGAFAEEETIELRPGAQRFPFGFFSCDKPGVGAAGFTFTVSGAVSSPQAYTRSMALSVIDRIDCVPRSEEGESDGGGDDGGLTGCGEGCDDGSDETGDSGMGEDQTCSEAEDCEACCEINFPNENSYWECVETCSMG